MHLEEMIRCRYTAVLNFLLFTIPVYVIYDEIVTTQPEALHNIKIPSLFNQTTTRVLSSDVIINTYMRAGSSFVGKMLGFRKDTFYVYEPLWVFHRYGYYRGKEEVCWTFSPFCSNRSDLDSAMKFMKSLYDCQLTKYSKMFKENIQPKLSGPSWDIYHTCRRNKAVENMTSCLRNEIAVCKNAKHRVTKVLRMSLDLMETFLNGSSNMKIIHLFRDPRAMLNSHFQTAWSPVRNGGETKIASAARALCDRISRDIEAGEKLQKTFPNRFRMIQYEDFDDPLTKINRLYKFLGMSQANETQRFISQPDARLTSGSDSNARGNHPFKYRTTLKWATVKLIDQHCGAVYEKLGYTKYPNEHSYRNLNISGIQSKLPYRL